jgi:hypothetical protein
VRVSLSFRQGSRCTVSLSHVCLQCRRDNAAGQPDAGDPHSSDSDGKGVWVTDGDRIKGKWVEVIADRASHKFTGRAEISYDIKVIVDNFAGTDTASSYDPNGTLTEGPSSPTPLEGKRVTFP